MKLRLPKLKLLLQKHRIAQLGDILFAKNGTFSAYLVTFALLKVCQIISNVTYYVEVNLHTLVTLPHNAMWGMYSLDFYCPVNFVYFRFFSVGWTLLQLLKEHCFLNRYCFNFHTFLLWILTWKCRCIRIRNRVIQKCKKFHMSKSAKILGRFWLCGWN